MLKRLVTFGADEHGVMAKGTLLKWTNLISGFQPRYFELRARDGGGGGSRSGSGGALAYALAAPGPDDGDEMAVRGKIHVANARVAVEPGSSRNFTVTEASTGQLFARIRCATERERAEWITALELAQRGERSPSGTAGLLGLPPLRLAMPSEEAHAVVAAGGVGSAAGANSAGSQEGERAASRGETPGASSLGSESGSSAAGRDTLSVSAVSVDITESECTSDDSVDELEGEHSEALRRLIAMHSGLRKQCESLAVKLASVTDGGAGAVLPASAAADFEHAYCSMLGVSADVVNEGIRTSQWLSERLREAVIAREEMERQAAALSRRAIGGAVAGARRQPPRPG